MSLETQIGSLVSAANNLTSEVAGKLGQIDQKVDQATGDIEAFVESSTYRRLYVDSVNGSDHNNGKTKDYPKKTIRNAVGSVPDCFTARIDIIGNGVYELIGSTAIGNRVITIIGSSSRIDDVILKSVPYEGTNSGGGAITYGGGFSLGRGGILAIAGVTLETCFIDNSSKPYMLPWSGSMMSTRNAIADVSIQHAKIKVNHGPFMHQHNTGSFGTGNLRMRSVEVIKGDLSTSDYSSLQYLMDQNDEQESPYELYGTDVMLSGFLTWAEAVRFNHSNVITNLL